MSWRRRKNNRYHPSGDEPGADVFPYVLTSYRLTEHFTAGGMTRWLPYIAELQPESFCEVSPELAAERGLENGGWATLVTARSAIEAKVLVTDRMTPLRVQGRVVHQIGMPYHFGPNGLATGDALNELSAVALDPNVHIQEVKALVGRHQAGPPAARSGAAGVRRRVPRARRHHGGHRHGSAGMTGLVGRDLGLTAKRNGAPGPHEHALAGPLHDVAADAGHAEAPPRMGFFTDTSVCIGCKACEVACKEWNAIPADPPAGNELTGWSFDNTQALGANTWRHVAFIEQNKPIGHQEPGVDQRPAGVAGGGDREGFRWLMSSDVCKHCTHAACLDVCPTGALVRTEFGTVVVQQDVCNGCGYCVSACPYGVIDQRKEDGRVFKCTLCYDRLGHGQEPACAKACPTQSIQFGPLDELRERAAARVETLHDNGVEQARLYGESPDDGVGGDGAFFLLLDEPEVYGLPPDPIVPTSNLMSMWRHAALAAATMLVGMAGAAASVGFGRRSR